MILQYIEPVFRPPAEANSLILQVTNGCSWNRCTYCEMYTQKQKKFSSRSNAEILNEIERIGQQAESSIIKRVFLADGDAMVLSTNKLLEILNAIKAKLPSVNRVGSYCLPRNIKKKSDSEMSELKDAGLGIAYVGAESGDDNVLKKIDKCETYASTVEGLQKLQKANIKRSVMILNGIGGKTYSKEHAMNSAKLVNETQPELLSTLVVSFPQGEARLKQQFPEFQMLSIWELISEMREFLDNTNLNRTIFRSNHASNYLELRGTLGKSKDKLLKQIDEVLMNKNEMHLKPEWLRGL